VVDFHIEAPLPARPLHGFGELVDRKGFGELIENAAFALRRRISDSQIDALDGICAFRGMAATDSDLSRPPIPTHRGQSFERMIVIAG
jgi:hypothetical protein